VVSPAQQISGATWVGGIAAVAVAERVVRAGGELGVGGGRISSSSTIRRREKSMAVRPIPIPIPIPRKVD
jgi:hypothetical protein